MLLSLKKIIVVSFSLGVIMSMTSLDISSRQALAYQISSPLSVELEISYKSLAYLLNIHVTTAPLGIFWQIIVIRTRKVYIYKSMTFLPQYSTWYLTAL